MNDHDDTTQDPGHGEPDHVHDENRNGAAELGMTLGGLPPDVTGRAPAIGAGVAAGADEFDHADEETKQETGTADEGDDTSPSEPRP